jgi:cytochrome P450
MGPWLASMTSLPYFAHRHPDFWTNPEGFDCGRFDPAREPGECPE